MNVAEIRDGLKRRVETVQGLRAYDKVPEKPEVPCVVVAPDEPFISYLEAMAGGMTRLNFQLVLLVQRGNDRSAQDALDAYLSAGTSEPLSIFDALMADRTLGGLEGVSATVRTAQNYGTAVTIGDSTFGQAVLKVSVDTPRT